MTLGGTEAEPVVGLGSRFDLGNLQTGLSRSCISRL
jgi:hypothetical protein